MYLSGLLRVCRRKCPVRLEIGSQDGSCKRLQFNSNLKVIRKWQLTLF
jgi:hypothetical protein